MTSHPSSSSTSHQLPSLADGELTGVTGGAPGTVAKIGYGLIVAGTIALGKPGGQRHDDPAAQPMHSPSSTSTSQAR